MSGEIAQIKIGTDYFRKCSRNEYSHNLCFIWLREAIQNSIDAGANNINIIINNDGWIRVVDDGCGMNKQIIIEKLLTLGGSQKINGNQNIGGFGKAKEILFFSWDEWFIDTSMNGKDWCYVDNSMINKSPIKEYKSDKNYKSGTVIGIKLNSQKDRYEDDVDNWVVNAKFFLKTCNTKANIYVNSDKMKQAENRGKSKETNWCNIITNKSCNDGHLINHVFVRMNGVTMFYRPIFTDNEASVFVDLKNVGDPTKIMSSSREKLKIDYQFQLERMIDEMTVDPKSSMKDSGYQIIFDEYKGDDLKDFLYEKKNKLNDENVNDRKVAEKKEIFNELIRRYEEGEIETKAQLQDEINNTIVSNDDINKKLCGMNRNYGISPLGYKFIVKRNGKRKPNINIYGVKCQSILHVWTSILLKLMDYQNINIDFGVGLTFDESSRAEIVPINNMNYFLINPNHVEKTSEPISLGIRLFHSATHELSHLYVDKHNENFSAMQSSLLDYLPKFLPEWKNLFRKSRNEVKELI